MPSSGRISGGGRGAVQPPGYLATLQDASRFTLSVASAGPDNNGVVRRPEIGSCWRPRPDESLRFVSFSFSSRFCSREDASEQAAGALSAYQEPRRARAIDRPIEAANEDTSVDPRENAPRGASSSFPSFSFAPFLWSRGVRYRDSRTNTLRRASIGLG